MQLAVKIAGPLYVLAAAGFGLVWSHIFRRHPAQPTASAGQPDPGNVIPFERGIVIRMRAAALAAEPLDRAQ